MILPTLDWPAHEPGTATFAALRSRLTDADDGVRRLALLELGDSEEEEHLPWLLHALQHDPEPELRAQAAALLASWEQPPVVEGLCRALQDEVAAVAAVAADSLSQLKTAAAGRYLLRWTDHAHASVRSAILRALRELRLSEAAVPALAGLHDADVAVRREAVAVLGWLRHVPALPALAQLLGSDADAEVRRAAAGALGFAAGGEATSALLQALHDSSWPVREEVATTLGKLQIQAAESALIATLDDVAWQVRLRAVQALGRLRSITAVPAVIEALRYGIGNVRREAAIALGEIGHVAALPALGSAGADPDPEVRKAARLALSRIGSRVAEPE